MPCRSGSPHEVLNAGPDCAPVVPPWHATATSATTVVKAATPTSSRIRCLISHLHHPLDAPMSRKRVIIIPCLSEEANIRVMAFAHRERPLQDRAHVGCQRPDMERLV